MRKILPLLLLLAMLCSLVSCKDTPTATTEDPLSHNLPYPYIDPTDYCKIDLDFNRISLALDKDLQIGDADVDEYIHKLQTIHIPDQITMKEVTNRPVAEGDIVYIYFYGTVDGNTFYGSTNHSEPIPYCINLSNSNFLRDVGVEGLEEGLIGITPEDTYSHLTTEGTVKEGDVVYISGALNYKNGTNIDTELFENSIRIDLGQVPASFGEGFAEKVVGATIGDNLNFSITQDFDGDGEDETKDYYLTVEKAGAEKTVTLTARFPALSPNTPEHAGKTADFEVVVSYIEEVEYPPLTVEFIKKYGKYTPTTSDPIGEYRELVKGEIEYLYRSSLNQIIEGRILDLFCENMTDVVYPEGTLVYTFQYYWTEIELLMKTEKEKFAEGTCPFTTLEEFVLLYYDDPALEGKTTSDVDEWIMAKCERNVKENLAVFYVGRALGYTVSATEVRRYAAALANQMNQEEATAKYTEEIVLRDLGWDYIECTVMYAKVMTYLISRTTVTYE